MRYILLTILFFLTINFLVPVVGLAQDPRPDMEEVQHQKKFIEASKLKLLGKLEEARKLYLEIYRANRQNHASAYEIARISNALEESEDTEKYIGHAIKADPDNEWYRRYYAQFLESNEKWEESAQQYEELILRYPSDQEYYEKLGALYEKNERWDKALTVYTKLENEKGLQENILRKRVICFDELGKKKEAISALKTLVRSSPNNSRYLNFLASYYDQSGDKKKASEIYQQVIEQEPDNEFANIAYANLMSANKPGVSRLESYRSLIENPQIDIDNKIPELIPIVNTMDNDSSLHTEVLSLLQTLTTIHPNEAKSYAIFGDALIMAGKLELGIDNFKKTIELNNTVYAVWEQLMYAQAKIGDYPGLEATAEQSLDYYPNQALGYYFYGLALHRKEAYNKATDILSEAMFIASNDPGLMFKIYCLSAENSLKQGSAVKALSYIENADKTTSGKDPYLFELWGDIYKDLALNHPEELFMRKLKAEEAIGMAREYYKKAIEAGGNEMRLNQKIQSPTIVDK